ncbi:DNA-binding protein [Micromonospora sp. CA-248089]|uniref:DNA-binding protein n=1 Tax=Micromonospora sp. CA-248089 TaxID=3239960 RepID=UPI003D93E7AC
MSEHTPQHHNPHPDPTADTGPPAGVDPTPTDLVAGDPPIPLMRSARRTRRPAPAANPRSDAAACTWTTERILALGATTDLVTAAAILGISRSAAYKLAARDAFPVPLFRAGAYYRVPTAPIRRKLHLESPPVSTTGDTDRVGADETDGHSGADRDTTGCRPPP